MFEKRDEVELVILAKTDKVGNGQIQINVKEYKWNGSFSFIYARGVYQAATLCLEL